MRVASSRGGLLVTLLTVVACEQAPPSTRAPTVRDAGARRDIPTVRDVPVGRDVPVARDVPSIDVHVTDVPSRDAPDAVDVDTRPIGELTLDDLRLIGVAGSRDAPVAMVATPSGFGESLRRGSFVGRAERLGSDAGAGVRWRVARITSRRLRPEADGRLTEVPAEVTFERPNPSAPNGVEQRSLTEGPADSGRNVGSIRLSGAGVIRDGGAR